MGDSTWLGRVAKRLGRLCLRLDSALYRDQDLDALARGWQVRRTKPFTRTYRDPRWDSIEACSACGGDGTIGADVCADCGGRGTLRHDIAEQPPHRGARVACALPLVGHPAPFRRER